MKSIKEINIEELPIRRISATELYNTVRRGVKLNTLPWNLPENNADVSVLQKTYDDLIEKQTETIMTVIINELFL